MAYPVWPATLSAPEKPLNIKRMLPLFSGEPDDLGLLRTNRRFTLPTLTASATVPVEAAEFQTFLTFWSTTLNDGKARFTADWLADVGFPEYTVRILSYTVGTLGIEPSISLELELLPDVRLDPTNTYPDQWRLI